MAELMIINNSGWIGDPARPKPQWITPKKQDIRINEAEWSRHLMPMAIRILLRNQEEAMQTADQDLLHREFADDDGDRHLLLPPG